MSVKNQMDFVQRKNCVCSERERERGHDHRKSENCITKEARITNSYKEREKVLM